MNLSFLQLLLQGKLCLAFFSYLVNYKLKNCLPLVGMAREMFLSKKNDLPKNPKYIDTRMDELFPVRKNSIRLRLLSKQEHSKVVTVSRVLFI